MTITAISIALSWSRGEHEVHPNNHDNPIQLVDGLVGGDAEVDAAVLVDDAVLAAGFD